MTWDQMRYVGNAVITLMVLAALYLLFAHRFSHRPFDYLWQGYVCPTQDFIRCSDDYEAHRLNVHYVDREVCKDETERQMSVEKIAESYPNVTIDVGFLYGCWRSDYHRSQLTPAQRQRGSVIDDRAVAVPSTGLPPSG